MKGLAAALDAFHLDYAKFYGYDLEDEAVEIVGLIVTAIGTRRGPTASFRVLADGQASENSRAVYFSQGGFQETAVVQREALRAGDAREGPLVVEEALSTTLVPPGSRLSVHPSGSLLVDLLKEA
jgi:N-methylhydantoinase A